MSLNSSATKKKKDPGLEYQDAKRQVTKDKIEKERAAEGSTHDTKKSRTRILAITPSKTALSMANGIYFGNL